MTRTLYLQCDAGISGDMVVGALLDAGASEEGLRAALESLGLDGYEVRVSHKLVGALQGCDFDVVVDRQHENHDHDMDWLYGGLEDGPACQGHDHRHHRDHGNHEHAASTSSAHDHAHEGEGGQTQRHHQEHHHHEHRSLADIQAIIARSDLSASAKDTALRIFGIIAEAEAKAHGATIDTVHFHEVGAVDSIVDVAAVAWCLDDLGIEDVVVSALAEGEGHVRSAHGVLSIPVPAVAHIVEAHGLVLRRAHRAGELVTPTGAAIAAALRSRACLPELYRVVATGMGTGKRAYDPPSSLRASIVEDVVEESGHGAEPQLWKLETEVDDCTGEALAYVLDRLYEEGAREAHFVPVFMKKGRPGYQVEVVCDEDVIPALERVLFEDTTTIGVRRHPLMRTSLEREADVVDTTYGPIRVKRVVLPDGTVRAYPEHDAVAEAAYEMGASYQDVARAVYVSLADEEG